MKEIVIGSVCLFAIAIFIVNLIFWADYSWHVSNSKKNCSSYASGSFDDFIKMYNSTTWKNTWPNFMTAEEPGDDSFKTSNWVSKVGIIRFKNIGMILDPISYIKYLIWWHDRSLTPSNPNPPWRK
jgi:hypothetical protein